MRKSLGVRKVFILFQVHTDSILSLFSKLVVNNSIECFKKYSVTIACDFKHFTQTLTLLQPEKRIIIKNNKVSIFVVTFTLHTE